MLVELENEKQRIKHFRTQSNGISSTIAMNESVEKRNER